MTDKIIVNKYLRKDNINFPYAVVGYEQLITAQQKDLALVGKTNVERYGMASMKMSK